MQSPLRVLQVAGDDQPRRSGANFVRREHGSTAQYFTAALAAFVLLCTPAISAGERLAKPVKTHPGSARIPSGGDAVSGRFTDDRVYTFSDGTLTEPPKGDFVGVPWDGWVAIFTGVLTVATIGLWVANWKSLEHARTTSERQLRAYVGVQKATIKNIGTDDPLEAWIVIKNSGQTPAYHLRHWRDMSLGPSPVREAPTDEELSQSVYLGPGDTFDIVATLERPTGIDLIMERTKADNDVWLTGAIYYTDAFGKDREFKFRYYWAGQNKLAPADTGNDAT